MKIYFVRHGESEANVLHEFSNRGLKHGLTATGIQQAQALAESLRGVPVTAIFSSPLLRARQTAEILSGVLGIAHQVTDALREFDCGIFKGKSDAAGWHAQEQLYKAWLVRQEWEQRIEQGESFVDMQQRFVPFVDELVRNYGTSTDAIVLVGHGGIYKCMLPLVLQNIDFQFSAKHGLSHTAMVVAELHPKGLICTGWGGA